MILKALKLSNQESFNAAGPSDNIVSPNFEIGGKSSVDPSQYPDDPHMPTLEDIIYSDDEEDVGVEADFSNLETNITVLVDLPTSKRAVGSKWVFRNKKDERWIFIRNKARLVIQRHTQEEGIDYEEVFASVARIEAIWLFLAYASFMGYMVYQMDVKNALLYETIEEEVYVCQPPGFEDLDYPDKIEKIMNEQLEVEVLTRSSNSSKTSYAVAADLSELELKKILTEKMESNKSIHRSDEHRNLYKSLVNAYERNKIILETYGDTVTLKRCRDDADKHEEPSARSDRGSKRRREGKEPESTSTPKEKATKTTEKSTEGSKSHQKTVSESAPGEEPMQTSQDLEEPAHQEFETGVVDDQPIAEASQHLEWF
nr:copia protein [Tanacetum cinerariifolium]